MRSIHRDLSKSERAKIKRMQRSLRDFVSLFEESDLLPEDLPAEDVEKLQAFLKNSLGRADDAKSNRE